MRNKFQPSPTKAVLLALALLFSGEAALAQGTAFTYQGKLIENGSPANGNYDFQFKLFDMLTGVNQQGSTVAVSNVTVTNGSFTLQLDFGVCPTCFDGSVRFLEIAVKQTSGSLFIPLTPRQPVNSNPYAIRSLNATTSDNATQLNGMPAGGFIQNTTSQQSGTNFNIGGNGTLGGTISANAVDATTQYNIGGSRVLSVAGTNNVFMGVTAGRDNTTGNLNSFFGAGAGNTNTEGFKNSFFGNFAGALNTTGSHNSFFGNQAGQNNTVSDNSFFGAFAGFTNATGTSNAFVGRNAGFNSTGSNNTAMGAFADLATGVANATAVGANAQVTQSNSLVLGSIIGVNGAVANTNVGIGTTAPLGKLQVQTTNDTNPGTVTAWDSRHFVIGGGASTGGIGMSYDQTNNVGYLEALSPSVFWRNLVLQSGGGNVGIGTTTPAARLAIKGNGTDVLIGDTGCGSPTAAIGFGSLSGCNAFSLGANPSLHETVVNAPFSDGRISFRINNTSDTMTISGGNVGIGTTSPSTRLHVAGSALVYPTSGNGSLNLQNRTNSNYSQVVFVDDTGVYRGYTGYIGANAGLASRNDTLEFGSNGKDITFRPSETEVMRLSPNIVQLQSAADDTGLIIKNTAANGNTWTLFSSGGSSSLGAGNFSITLNSFPRMTINPTSNLISLGGGLDVDGNIRVGILDASTSTTTLCWNGTGNKRIVGCSSSSKRYKDHITSFNPGLEIIKQLRPVTFNWKSNGERDFGLVAEEVHEVNPLLTFRNDKGEIEGVKYDRLNVVLVNALNQQQRQIESLQHQNADMKARLTMLEKIVQELSKRSRRRSHWNAKTHY